MNYNYSGVEKYARNIGVVWHSKWFAPFDEQAKVFGFTQAQIDVALQHHLWNVKNRIFNPKEYAFKDRIKIAASFLIGRRIK